MATDGKLKSRENQKENPGGRLPADLPEVQLPAVFVIKIANPENSRSNDAGQNFPD
jgi:hypothetical protein